MESGWESVNTQVSVPSDGAEEAVREPHLWQKHNPPPPNPLRVAPNARKMSTQGSTTWSRGAVSPDTSYETLLWEWGRGCLLTWPRIAPPVRTPPSQPNTGVLYPGAGNRAVFELGMPPHRRSWWVGDYGPRLPPPALLSDHQQVSAETHETWEKYGN